MRAVLLPAGLQHGRDAHQAAASAQAAVQHARWRHAPGCLGGEPGLPQLGRFLEGDTAEGGSGDAATADPAVAGTRTTVDPEALLRATDLATCWTERIDGSRVGARCRKKRKAEDGSSEGGGGTVLELD